MTAKRMAVAIVTALALLATGSPAAAAPFEITSFDGEALKENGETATQAGSHPYTAATTFALATEITPAGRQYSTETLKDAVVDLPPGLIGNPQAIPACTEDEIQGEYGKTAPLCPLGSQVGVLMLAEDGPIGTPGNPLHVYVPLYNMEPPAGVPAVLGFNFLGSIYHLGAKVRTGDDYGVTVEAINNPHTVPFEAAAVTVWGAPASPTFDPIRGDCMKSTTGEPLVKAGCPKSAGIAVKPFFTLPTSCLGPVETTIVATSWEGSTATGGFLSHDQAAPPNPIGNDGCASLQFAPTLQVRPTTTTADSPTGLDVALHLPQNEDPAANATAHLKRAVVTLPEGLVVNPASGNGLQGCSSAQIDLQGEGSPSCPGASRIGSVEVDTPVLDHPLPGSVYVASPHDNPFGSLLAIYLVIDDPESGVVVKLAGHVVPDPSTGRLTTTFDDNPQLPFEDFRLKFFAGNQAALRTQPTCGTYATTSSFTPWSAPDSGPPAASSDSYPIDRAPASRPCAESEAGLPNSPTFEAGTENPAGGVHSPFVVNLRRDDATQQFSAVTVTPPPGLVAKLAGIPYCPDSVLAAAAARKGVEEAASPSCPSASRVGSVVAGAGAGAAPYYARGDAYLAGPYKGAPLSLAIITPAVAGPFDLGTVVVRTAIYVNQETARISAKADPIPPILQGIPLDVRSISVRMDRPEFTLNPTSCDPMAVEGASVSPLGQIAPLSSRFQATACDRLKFAPRLSLRLRGRTRRGGHPSLRAVLRMPAGGANVSRASVALPHSEFLEQGHIRTICTRVQFAADACPAGAVYGRARAFSPLLEKPLEGPVYLRSSSNPLPDLVADLNGQVRVVLAGRIDSVRGGIRTTFELVPDAPVSKFVLTMQGNRKGLLVNSRDLCESRNRATVRMDAQNGRIHDFRPLLRRQCATHTQSNQQRRQR